MNVSLAAKILGVWYLIAGLLNSVGFIFYGDRSPESLPRFILGLWALAFLVTAFGLFKMKRWSIYGVGLVLLLTTAIKIYTYTNFQNVPDMFTLVITALEIFLLFLFWTNKEAFKK